MLNAAVEKEQELMSDDSEVDEKTSNGNWDFSSEPSQSSEDEQDVTQDTSRSGQQQEN